MKPNVEDHKCPTCNRNCACVETIVLSERDAEIFIDAINNPPEPNEALKELVKKHKKTEEEKCVAESP